jgi:type I restriction enzyme S subunit
MSEWKEYKLGELCEITSSRRIFLNEYVSYGVPFYRSKEIIEKAKGNEISTELFITLERFNEIKSKNNVPVENDILLTSVGTLGVSYLVSKSDFFYFKDGNLTWLRNYTNHIYPKYLLHWLRSSIAKERFQEISIGSTQAALTIQGLKGIKIKIPEYSHQVNIAEILSSLDDKIVLNNKINQELESLSQLLFKRWFVDFEFPNEIGEPYKSSGGEMIDTELGKIPKAWEIGALSSIAILDKSNIKPFEFPNKEFYHFSLPDYDNGKKPALSIGSDILSSKYKVSPNSVLVSKLNPRIPRVWVITDCEDNCICSTEFQVVRPKSFHYFTFLCNLCSSEKFFDSLKSKVTGTSSSHQRVNPNDIINYIMPLPSIEIVQKYSLAFNENSKLINKNIQENNSLSQLRDTLLPKLISGELQINDN